jgi:hypothetical protein
MKNFIPSDLDISTISLSNLNWDLISDALRAQSLTDLASYIEYHSEKADRDHTRSHS